MPLHVLLQVKGVVTEQQYLELYSAAQWCFNLTPSWAGTLPSPPLPATRPEPRAELPLEPPVTGAAGKGSAGALHVMGGAVDGKEGSRGASIGASDYDAQPSSQSTKGHQLMAGSAIDGASAGSGTGTAGGPHGIHPQPAGGREPEQRTASAASAGSAHGTGRRSRRKR